MHQAVKPLFNSEDVPTIANGRLDGRSNHRIQCGTIATTRENTDSHAEILLDPKAISKLFV